MKQLQTSVAERSPEFTPLGSPSAADDAEQVETATPPSGMSKKAKRKGRSQPLAPMARPPQPTATEGVQQDAAAEALLALLGAAASAAPVARRTGPANRHELLRQARMAHHRLRLSLGVQSS